MMDNKPILLNTPMVLATLNELKTQTRRIYKHYPNTIWDNPLGGEKEGYVCSNDGRSYGVHISDLHCPYGSINDLLWVRETFRADGTPIYKADVKNEYLQLMKKNKLSWKPSIFMPKLVSRITLEITNIRVERLNDISKEDAIAEGLSCITKDGDLYKYGIADSDGYPGNDNYGWPWDEWEIDPRVAYKKLWEKINGKGSWDKNPWIWVINFKPHLINIDNFTQHVQKKALNRHI